MKWYRQASLLTAAIFSMIAVHLADAQTLMQIEQVIGGVSGDTTAQAIQLRMRAAGQNAVTGMRLVVRNGDGMQPIELINFPSDVLNGNASDRILISSPAFSDYTDMPVTSDFMLTGRIPTPYLQAGSLTYENSGGTVFWRLSWGGYTGSTTGDFANDFDGDFGAPLPEQLPAANDRAVIFQGLAANLSNTNQQDYMVTGPAIFTNNSSDSFTITGGWSSGQDIIPVSVKRILNSNGDRSSGVYSTDASIQGTIDQMNGMLQANGFAWRLVLMEIVDVPDISHYWNVIPEQTFSMLQVDANTDPERFAWRRGAVNIYICNSMGSSVGGRARYPVYSPLDNASGLIVINNQGISGGAIGWLHELGHHYGLPHTFQCSGNCDVATCVTRRAICRNYAARHVTLGDICNDDHCPHATNIMSYESFGFADAELSVRQRYEMYFELFAQGGRTARQTPLSFDVSGTPADVATADLDGDTLIDIVVISGADVTVLLNSGKVETNESSNFFGEPCFDPSNPDCWDSATYAIGGPFGSCPCPTAVVIADFDGVNGPDIATANRLTDGITVLYNDGNGQFPTKANFPVRVPWPFGDVNPYSLTAGDFDGQPGGPPDLAVTLQSTAEITVALNNGAGGFPTNPNDLLTFRLLTGGAGDAVSIVSGNFDADDDDEIVIALLANAQVRILDNVGPPGFYVQRPIETLMPLAPWSAPASLAVGDIDGDGRLDVGIAEQSADGVRLALGDGALGFPTVLQIAASQIGGWPRDITLYDADGDLDLDIGVAQAASFRTAVIRNSGNRQFELLRPYAVGAGVAASPVAIAAGDLDNDGVTDLVVATARPSENVTVVLNREVQRGAKGIIATPTRNLVTDETGIAAVFTVALAQPPAANVVINLISSDTNEGTVVPQSLIFTPTNWDVPQTITVTGVDDTNVDGSRPYTITMTATSSDPTYDGAVGPTIDLANLDDETISVTSYIISGRSTGVGWPWRIIHRDFTVTERDAPGLPRGSSAAALAAAFVQRINAASPPVLRADVLPATPEVFRLTVTGTPGISSFCFGQGAGPIDCCVSGVGPNIISTNATGTCTFNPTIVQLTGQDCDGNGVDDALDIRDGTRNDCNLNGVPDDCDLANGFSVDADGDGAPDECNPISLTEGACCLDDGSCAYTTESECNEFGRYRGDGTVCLGDRSGNIVDDTCEVPLIIGGACCFGQDQSCARVAASECQMLGGVYWGDSTSCHGDNDGSGIDDVCEGGALVVCCLPEGACADSITEPDCIAEDGLSLGPSATCTEPQACCLENGACLSTGAECCGAMGGIAQEPGSACEGDADGNNRDDACEEPIPTVSEWGLVVLTLLLLAIAKIYYSRRRSTQA